MKTGLDDYVIKSPKHFIRLPAAVGSALVKTLQRQALREAEIRYRNLFEDVPVGLYRATPGGQILDANPALVQMLGYPDSEALKAVQTADLYVNPQDHQRWQSLVQREGVVRNFAVQPRRRDGTIIWVENNVRAVRDAEGWMLYYEGGLVDITGRKRAEETLQSLYWASLQIQEPLNLQERLDRLLQTAREILHLDRLNILLADSEGRWLRAVASLGTEEPFEAMRVLIGPEGGGFARVYLDQKTIAWPGPGRVPETLRLKPPYDRIEAFRSRVFAIVPLLVQGRAIGVLGVDWRKPPTPSPSS